MGGCGAVRAGRNRPILRLSTPRLARTAPGEVYGWGRADSSQLGLGGGAEAMVARDTPVRVPGVAEVRSIACGSNHCCAVTADGVGRVSGGTGGLGGGVSRSLVVTTAVTSIFATAPAATRPMVSRALERPPPATARTPYLI